VLFCVVRRDLRFVGSLVSHRVAVLPGRHHSLERIAERVFEPEDGLQGLAR